MEVGEVSLLGTGLRHSFNTAPDLILVLARQRRLGMTLFPDIVPRPCGFSYVTSGKRARLEHFQFILQSYKNCNSFAFWRARDLKHAALCGLRSLCNSCAKRIPSSSANNSIVSGSAPHELLRIQSATSYYVLADQSGERGPQDATVLKIIFFFCLFHSKVHSTEVR